VLTRIPRPRSSGSDPAIFVPSSVGASPDRRAASTIVINTIQRSTAFASVDADHNGKPSIGDYSVARSFT
jgi:hypothetical protein